MIPLTVVTGFFGSGKTSLVAHVLDTTTDREIGVVIDEFGQSGIDGAYLRGGEHPHDAPPPHVTLVAGTRSGLEKREAIRAALIAATERSPEAVLLESSGITPARALAAFLTQDREIATHYHLDSVIAVADGTALAGLLRNRMTRTLILDQLAAADLVVLNKSDRIGRWTRRRLMRRLARLAPNAAVGESRYCRLPLEEVVATGRRQDPETRVGLAASGRTAAPPAPMLVAHDLDEPRPFHPERLHRWLDREWPEIVRVKGIAWLATDMDHLYVIDVAGEQREVGLEGTWYAALAPSERPPVATVDALMRGGPYGDRRQRFTIVGAPGAVKRELRNLRACLLSGPEEDRGPEAWRGLANPIETVMRRSAEEPEDQSR